MPSGKDRRIKENDMQHIFATTILPLTFLIMTSGSCRAEEIRLPACLYSIEDNAFENCELIDEVYLPERLENLSDTAFNGSSEVLWMHCPQNDMAISLLNKDIDVDADTKCRALIIAQTYSGTDQELEGTLNDASAVSACLQTCVKMDYVVDLETDLTAEEIRNAILTSFSGTTAYDISLLFYSGHGGENGAIVGNDGSLLTAQELRGVLDSIAGRKIIILDACYSGGFIEEQGIESLNIKKRGTFCKRDVSKSEEEMIDSFNSSVLSAFTDNMRKGRSLSSVFNKYLVMTSARSYQTSMEAPVVSGNSSKIMGFFSYYLCQGCGWDEVLGTTVDSFADANGDGIVSFAEAFTYAKRQARIKNNKQDAQSNMPDCTSFSPFRK